MTFTQSIRTCFRKYITFSGRASRPEYWWFFLFLLLGQFVAAIGDAALFGVGLETTDETDITDDANGPLAGLFGLATFLPALAAGWRRMHDTGRSGLYLLYPLFAMLGLITFVGLITGFENVMAGDIDALMAGGLGIVVMIALVVIALSPLIVLFWLTRPSEQGANQYGPNPHEVSP